MNLAAFMLTLPFVGVAMAQYKLEITIPPSKASIKKIEDCICEGVVVEMGGKCKFEHRRLADGSDQVEMKRSLQGGSCAQCNPGPSGYWCRLMHCRRRMVGENEGESEPPSVAIQEDIDACLSMKAGEGVQVLATPAN
jgi:hypothetical protein